MSKVHFITDAANKNKLDGIQNALRKIPISDIYFDPIACEQNEYKPLNIGSIILALDERAENLLKNYENPLKDTLVYVIAVQKGVDLTDGQPAKLICAVSITAKDNSKFCRVLNSTDLPEEIRTLIKKGMDLYDAYGEFFGEEIKQKKISLYEKLTGKSESSWIEETTLNVLKSLTF